MDFMLALPKDAQGNTDIVVFVDRLSKMAHLAAVPYTTDGEGTATLFFDRVFRQHGFPVAFVIDRDPLFTGKFFLKVHLQDARHTFEHVHGGSPAYRWSNRASESRHR